MAAITYTAKREIEPTGFSKTGTDFSAIGSDDSFDAATTNISGLLTDQWLQAAGFVKNPGWFQVKSNSTSAKILTNTPPVTHLRLPGVGGNSASTPDSVANSVTGDIDLRVRVSLVRWTAFTSTLLAKNTSSGNQRAYYFSVNLDGSLRLIWTPDGTAASQINKQSTVAIGIVDGAVKWVRVTLKVNNGAAGNDVKFYTSDDGIIWTQLGTTVTTAGVTSIFDSTAILSIGVYDGTAEPANGRFYYAEVRNGIDGTVVAAFDPTRGTRGAGSLVALTGETWTINTSGTPPALLQGPLLTYEGAEYLSLDGAAGHYASTPDSAAVSVVGSIELLAQVAATLWVPATVMCLISKDDGTTNRDYNFYLDAAGKLNFLYTTDGSTTAGRIATSTVAVPFAALALGWVKVTYVTGTGVVQFFTSIDGVAFTQLGTNITLTSGAIHDGTSLLQVGSGPTGSNPFNGKLYYASVRNGVAGPVVAAFDPGRAAAGAGSLVAYTGETWTMQNSAPLVRTTPVTITGYKRGFGQSYSMDFNLTAYERGADVSSSKSQPIGGGAPEVLLNRIDTTADVTTGLLSEAQLAQWREFRSSVWAGEIFTFDPYGSVASPSEAHQAILTSKSWKEVRHDVLMLYRVSFNMRLLT